MLEIGLSLGSGIKLLERAIWAPARSINRKVQDLLNALSLLGAVAETKAIAIDYKPGLRIARTTLPDQSVGFNDTFLHIRYELDLLYKAQNPMFTNTIVPIEVGSNRAKPVQQTKSETLQPVGRPLVAASRAPQASERALAHQALHVVKTTQPDQRLDFNQTFLHIRYGLDGFYGRQHLN